MKYSILLFVLLLSSCWGFGQKMEGSWKGEVAIQGTTLPIIFHLKEGKDGKWIGDMVSPAQSSTRVPFSKVNVIGDSINVEVLKIGFVFSGKLLKGKLDGVFEQRQFKAPLLMLPFKEKVKKRPQEPHPPYSYDTLDVSFTNQFDNVRLSGTLSFPRNAGKHPAVILVTGSGPQDRDETIEGHKPFKVIADYLTKRGVVVLRYDERGVGKSSGNYTTSTIGDFSKDAIASLEFLKKQKQVDPKRIGIIGHSEGGLIAQLIAGQRSANVNFIALLAAPTIAIDSLMVLQAYEIGRVQGLSEAELTRAKKINRRNFAIVKSDAKDEQAYKQILENMAPVFPKPSQQQENELKMLLLPSYRYFMRIEPVPFIKKIAVPVFAVFGTKDLQVPFAPNLESLSDNLPKRAGHFLKAYEGLNHLFQQSKTGAPMEYGDLEETFSDVVLKDLAAWILDR
ncbi:alpha/beta hydrolase family protein [Sphingobacterium deserti]|uniref:Alpha/beta hydrolase fold protein n=1 Tax=Sphingobacterium deserti TaxID=1229276 RepID=A0A0B8T0R2_9SPHI|nr:alpha/beta fold hydrolase [Sphingobacterium deserti]KGE14041.1 alpha/beta hydrolase fold protein [Sphingobacterium deserti]